LPKQNEGRAPVKWAQDVGGGDEVPLIVDEETIPIEQVAITPLRRHLIDWVDDRTDGRRQCGIVSGTAGRWKHAARRQEANNGDERIGDHFATQDYSHGDSGKSYSPHPVSIASGKPGAIDLRDRSIALETLFQNTGTERMVWRPVFKVPCADPRVEKPVR